MADAEPAIEGRAVCDARAYACRCAKDAGHDVAAGDPVHACAPDRCTGSWTGSFDAETFRPVTMPFPVGEPRPWEIP